jgi:tRNA threonylcarbamoyladenosine biosynthesis protein TsaE
MRTRSAEETREAGAALARRLKKGAVLLLEGEYGSGKTTFVQGLARGLGVRDVRVVCSPTFVLMNVYRGRVPLYHMDATRLGDPREVFELGWEERGSGVTAVEWGEKVEGLLGAGLVRVEFRVTSESERDIRIHGLPRATRRPQSKKGK